jgi:phytoene desaturase
MEDYLELIKLDPQWRCFFADGSILDLHQDVEKMATGLASFSQESQSAQEYRGFLKVAARLHEISDRFFFWRSVGSPWDICGPATIFRPALLRALIDMRPGQSVGATVRGQVSDARVAQMLEHLTQYVGSAPEQSPAVLCGIAHMQSSEGVWYPMGGMGAVPLALESLAVDLGVELSLDVGVRRILRGSDNRIRGLETDAGAEISLAAVVANSDIVRTHRDLIGGTPERRFTRRRHYEPACSGVVLYLGLDRAYDHLAHHNFIFSREPEEEFESIYHQGEPASDPTCYVAAPGRTEPAVAPAGGEALYVLVHAPYVREHHDWSELMPRYRRTILNKLSSADGLSELEQRIRFERWLTPQDIQDRYAVQNGAIYGLASHGKFVGAFKPANRSPDLVGLYFAGGSAHPGPGVPMVLMSGWIAADALDNDGLVPRARSGINPR